MNSKKSLTIALAALLFALILPAAAMAQPAVSVECAYDNPTSNDLVCQVWVDTSDTLRTAGVLVNYNSSILTYVSATRGPEWVLTAPGAPAGGYDYPNWLDTGTAEKVIMIVGYFDSENPTAGITGREKVADITFERSDTPPAGTAGADQAAFFGISAALGRQDPFVNFVNTAGTNLDTNPPIFSAIVNELGDANNDGIVSPGDQISIRNAVFLGNPLANTVAADCNKDGIVTPGDMVCIRNKVFGL